jgi:hypothetical protein
MPAATGATLRRGCSHLAGPQGKVHIFKCLDTRKGLVDAFHREDVPVGFGHLGASAVAKDGD